MKTNREKLNNLITETDTKLLEEVAFRKANREWLRQSKRIAAKVLLALEEQNLSQRDLASKLNVSPQYISKLVKGKENLTIETIVKLERELNISIFERPSFVKSLELQSSYLNLDDKETWEQFTVRKGKTKTSKSSTENPYLKIKTNFILFRA